MRRVSRGGGEEGVEEEGHHAGMGTRIWPIVLNGPNHRLGPIIAWARSWAYRYKPIGVGPWNGVGPIPTEGTGRVGEGKG